MVSLPTIRRTPATRQKLSELVNQSLHDLSELHRYANQLRSAPENFAEADFSPRELDSLIVAVREGQRTLQPHAGDVGSTPIDASGISRRSTAPSVPTGLIIAYKHCSRHLDLALQEARSCRAARIGHLLFRLLRNLEKQLWLFNVPPKPLGQSFALVGLLQAC